MKGTTFAEYIRKQTGTNSTTLPDADIVTYANVEKDDISADIVSNVDEHYFDMELSRDLEVGIRNYTFADDLLKHSSGVYAQLDGTLWSPLIEADNSQFDETAILQNASIKELYTGKKPQFLIRGRELVILSGDDIIAVTDGLQMIAQIYPEDITTAMLAASDELSVPTTDTTHSLPRQTHKHWATKVVIAYKESRDKPLPLTKKEQKVDLELDEVYKKLTPRNINRSFVASVPRDDGQDY